MLNNAPDADLLKSQLREALEKEKQEARTVKVPKNNCVYRCEDKCRNVYFIESGQVKLLMLSPEGKECLVAIYSEGDIFGEQCLAHVRGRLETVVAMEDAVLRQIPGPVFFQLLEKHCLLENFVRYLTLRVADQQNVIHNLVTENSEKRLGKTLLELGRKLGNRYSRSVMIRHKISHLELSEMVGTTRPRVSKFMGRFKKLDLIEMSPDHFIIVKEKNLTSYLAEIG